MAAKDHDASQKQPYGVYDGALRCGLCPDSSAKADNDWCPVSEGVVCEDCCRALMMGDERLLEAVALRLGEDVSPEDVVAKCTECERLIRLVSEHILDNEADGVRLPMH